MAALQLRGGPGGGAAPGGRSASRAIAAVGRPTAVARPSRAEAPPAPTTRTGARPSRAMVALASALAALGLIADVAAALRMIEGGPLEGLLLHGPAALLWALGAA